MVVVVDELLLLHPREMGMGYLILTPKVLSKVPALKTISNPFCLFELREE